MFQLAAPEGAARDILRRVAVKEFQALCVYDHAGSLGRMGQDLQLFREMAGFLRDDAPRWQQELRAGLDAQDSRRVKHAAHTLKGLVANFGAPRAEKAARVVEQGAARSNWSELLPAAAELEEAIEELLSALSSFAPAGDSG